jgi:hypothetical protein
MAKAYGGLSQKIRIYGYALRRDGLGYKKVDKLAYYPEPRDETTQDPNMPGSNLRYFELDFNKLDEFDYVLFLGAFLADMQTFVVKTEGMAGNEFLFAFNAITGSIDIGDIYPTMRGEVKPCFIEEWREGLVWADESAHEDLEVMFTAIMDNFKQDNFVTLHRYQDIKVWRNYCERVSALKEFSKLVNNQ